MRVLPLTVPLTVPALPSVVIYVPVTLASDCVKFKVIESEGTRLVEYVPLHVPVTSTVGFGSTRLPPPPQPVNRVIEKIDKETIRTDKDILACLIIVNLSFLPEIFLIMD